MRIAVYSGSFNPLHIGHQAIMEYLTRDKMFDWVYLVISPQNPFKDASNVITAEDRYHAAIEAVKRHPELHVWVDDIELHMDPPHYTIKTLDALKRREPDNEFVLVMGADNLDCIRKWRDFQRLLSQYGVAVYPRKGFDIKEIRKALYEECIKFPAPTSLDASGNHEGNLTLEDDWESLYHIQIIDEEMVDISSTEIREAQARGEDVSDLLM